MPALRRNALLQLVLCLTYATPVATSNYTDAVRQLRENLLLGYDKDTPPMENATTPAEVHCTFLFGSLLTFDELSMELTTSSYIAMTWKEHRIKWQPSQDNGFTETINIPVSKVWSPGLALINPTEIIDTMNKNWMTVRYMSDGTAFIYGGGVFKSICSVDVTYYPFDTQECSLNFMSVNYQNFEMKLVSMTDKMVFSDFEQNGVWEIDDTKSFVLDQDGYYVYANRLYLRRRPLFFVVNILLPVVFMALLNIFVFALPPESGERMSYCITVLLAIAVFLTLLGDNIPKTSSPMSFLSYFLLVYLSLSVCICIATIYNLRIFHTKESKQIPNWLKRLTQALNNRSCKEIGKIRVCQVRTRKAERSKPDTIREDKGTDNGTSNTETSLCPELVQRFSKNSVRALDHTDHEVDRFRSSDKSCWIESLETDLNVRPNEFVNDKGDKKQRFREDKEEEEEMEEENRVTWSDVSHMVDKVLALTSLVVIIATVLAFYVIVSRNT